MIGIAVLVIALTHPGPATLSRYPVIMIRPCAMGVQNALMRRWGIRDLATNLFTLMYTGLCGDSPLGGGSNPRALRRGASLVIFAASVTTGAFLTRYGVLWPVLTAFTLFALALPILLQPQDTHRPSLPVIWRQPGRGGETYCADSSGEGRRCRVGRQRGCSGWWSACCRPGVP